MSSSTRRSAAVTAAMPIEPAWLSVANAATLTSLSPKTIRRMLAAGKLTSYRPMPGCVRIARAELESVMRASANGRTRRSA